LYVIIFGLDPLQLFHSMKFRHADELKPAKMILKPVVQFNNSLNFEASDALKRVMAIINLKLAGAVAPLCFVFISSSIALFNVSGQTSSPAYVVAQFILATVAFSVARYLLNRVGSVVIKTAKRISITGDTVSVAPFTFGVYFWTKKPLDYIEFKINELKIRKTDNPLKFTQALNNRVFDLRDKEKEVFIVFDFFDETLKERLTEILVEVTPPELLIPGRMRHY